MSSVVHVAMVILHTQMFTESKDEIALVLFGTSGNYFITITHVCVLCTHTTYKMLCYGFHVGIDC